MLPDQQPDELLLTSPRGYRWLARWRGCALIAFSLLALPVAAMVDVNTNGLSDVWENLYRLSTAPGADPDGDGQSNYQEAVAGTDPQNAASVFRLQSTVEASALLLWWPSVAGRRYQIETASAFAAGNWSAQGPVLEGLGGEMVGAVPRSKSGAMACRLRVVSDSAAPFASRAEFLYDTDGDGFSDWSEYGADTDPFDTNSCLRIIRTGFGKAVRLSWPGVAGKQYVLQSATNAFAPVWGAVAGTLTGVTGTMSVTVVPQGARQFFRVRVADDDSDGDGVTDWEERMTGTDIGPYHYRTNFPTSVAQISARLNATNLVSLEIDRPTANVTTLASASLRVTRSGNLAPLTIPYNIVGDAISGTDYQPLNGTISLPPGAAEARITIVPLAGASVSPARTMTVNLAPGAGYALGTNATAEIHVVKEVALSVKDFGAVGDGMTDDTAAIQAAIDALEASVAYNTLHFPTGVYRLNTWTNDGIPNFTWYHLLKLGNTELAGRDLFFTGVPGAKLYSTVHELRAHMLLARGRFRTLTFRGMNWAKEDTALPETTREPNEAGGVLVVNQDLRRVEAVDFLDCTFDNCHGAVELVGLGYDLRGRLANFGFYRCGVTNLFGPNTTNSWLAYGGGQQVRVSPWVDRAIYADNYFDGGSAPPDFGRNPGGRRKDGSHFGTPLRLIFTNNLVRFMEAEAVHQKEDPYMATTAGNTVIPPPDGTPCQLQIFPVASTFVPGQLLNCRTFFVGGGDPTNIIFRVVSYDAINRLITVTNVGLSPTSVVGLVIPTYNSIYLSDPNPTEATITGNLIESDFPTSLAGITANARALIRGNTIIGCQHGIYNYESERNPLHPPTTGLVIESNVILTQSSMDWPYYATGILSHGPGERISNNLILAPHALRFRGIVCRYDNSWVEGNTIMAQTVVHYGYDSPLRALGIGFSAVTSGGVAVANRTRGMDTGVGPEGPYQFVPHRVILHQSRDDVLPVDPLGLMP